MPESSQPIGDSQQSQKPNRNTLRAAHLKYKSLPVGLRYIIRGALICVAVVVAISVFHPSLNERVKFGTDMTLNILILLAIAVQAYIYTQQWSAMAQGLAIERAKTDQRLRIAEVKAVNFEANKRPIFIVTIANDGLIDATGVSLHISVMIDRAKKLDWINDPIVTIPARAKESYYIHSSSWFSHAEIDDFNKALPLKVVGHFTYWPVGRTEFCYKYLPWEGGRPLGIPQFVPCDFDPRLNTTLQIQGAVMKTTAGNVTLTVQKNPPEVASTQRKNGQDGKEDRTPN